jgi:hypothetical protein
MQYVNDWMVLGLVVGLLCGGLVAGRRFGSLAAWWLAGGAWLSFRLADRLWRTAVTELRADDPGLDMAFWLPVAYGALFLALFVPVACWALSLKAKRDFQLPGGAEALVASAGGAVTGLILTLALVQAHVLHPLAPRSIPATLAVARPVLSALGQKYVAPIAASPAAPPAPKDGGR